MHKMKKKEEEGGDSQELRLLSPGQNSGRRHMMQRPPLRCHAREESCTNSLTSTPLTISYRGSPLQPSSPFPQETGWP